MIAYCDTPSGKNQLNNGGYVPYGPLTDWHGTRIGTYWITNTYRNNLGADIECIAARVGRSAVSRRRLCADVCIVGCVPIEA